MFKNIYENKFEKFRKGRIKGRKSSWSGSILKYGDYGVKILENGYITFNHLEAIRRVIVAKLARQGQIWFYAIPNMPKTGNPLGQRMGAGKGSVEQHVLRAKKGAILFEFTCKSPALGLKILKIINSKLPLKIEGISRQ